MAQCAAKARVMSVKKYRSRVFFLLLYPDNPTHLDALGRVQRTYEYVSIRHDKDAADGGGFKKPHYHVFLKFKNAKWNTAVADDLGLEPRFIEEIRSEKAALQYLLHANEENKHHYDISELEGSKHLLTKLVEYMKGDEASASEQFTELSRAIYELNITSYASLLEYAVFKGLVKEFRSSAYILSKMVDENRKGQACVVVRAEQGFDPWKTGRAGEASEARAGSYAPEKRLEKVQK